MVGINAWQVSQTRNLKEVFFNAESWRGCSANMLSALDSSDSGNNQDRMHLLVKPFQKAVLPVGFVSDRYQSSVVLRMAAIRSRGSKRLEPRTEQANRKLDESGNDAWLLSQKTTSKVSTSAASLDRGAQTSKKKKNNENKLKKINKNQCWVLSGFRLCYRQKRTDLENALCTSISFLFPVRVSRCHGHTHFHKNSSRAPFLLLLSDDLYVPNLNANPEKKNRLPQWVIMHPEK